MLSLCIYIRYFLFLAFFLITAASAEAFTLEKAVMPGELSSAHAKYESDCEKCHTPFSREVQNSLCLKCHDKVATDIKQKQGFHGHSPSVASSQCKRCHTEHTGRTTKIIKLDEELFNHNETNFPLKGAHADTSLKCDKCHLAGKGFKDVKSGCYDCHKKDDVHKDSLGHDCKKCHDEVAWKKQDFDHSKTKFPLEGGHKKAACRSCHTDNNYKETPSSCVACHLVNDVHKSSADTKCEKCHTSENWKKVSFDHSKTDFALTGKHVSAKCDKCHQHNVFSASLGKQCISCHKTDDVHKGHLGNSCADCHTTSSWKQPKFDHDKKTSFPLNGKHEQAKCTDCHKKPADRPSKDCYSCHQKDDKHKGTMGKMCAQCHNEKSWKSDIKFEHDLTNFPLLGKHLKIGCDSCHKGKEFKGAPTDCISCHEKNDVHKGSLGKDCLHCHNSVSWKLWQFDHGKQTGFQLEGAHEKLSCGKCHRKGSVFEKMEQDCYGCHEKDDIHHQQFGRDCQQCHNNISFKDISVR